MVKLAEVPMDEEHLAADEEVVPVDRTDDLHLGQPLPMLPSAEAGPYELSIVMGKLAEVAIDEELVAVDSADALHPSPKLPSAEAGPYEISLIKDEVAEVGMGEEVVAKLKGKEKVTPFDNTGAIHLGQASSSRQEVVDLDLSQSKIISSQPSSSASNAWRDTEQEISDLDWASAPEDGAWATGAWGPGKWKPVQEGEKLKLWHWCLQNIGIDEEKIERHVYYQMRDNERRCAIQRGYPENEIKAIDTLYLPCSYFLEENKELYKGPENVLLCKAYDDYRKLIYPELCHDIYSPDLARRSSKLLHHLTEIYEKAKDIIGNIEAQGKMAMPMPFKWWIDMNAERMRAAAIRERERKVELGKID